MRNSILAAAAAFALVVSAAPTFAAATGDGQQNHQSQANEQSSNSTNQCDNIRANPEQWGATSDEVRRCKAGN
jgi:hypothetical protein